MPEIPASVDSIRRAPESRAVGSAAVGDGEVGTTPHMPVPTGMHTMTGVNGVRIDLARLARAGETLHTVKTEFEGAQGNARALADAVGHDGLANTLTDFTDKWDDRRADMVANIDALATAAAGIAEAFGTLDSDYAIALEGRS